jgi:ribosome-associated protein
MQPPPEATILRLDDLLKLAGVVDSGGQAKALIQGGKVVVNGEVDTRRGRKLVATDQVSVGGRVLTVDSVLKVKAAAPDKPAKRKDTPFDAPRANTSTRPAHANTRARPPRGDTSARPPRAGTNAGPPRAKDPRRKPRNVRRP